jgi:tetratricopeptide (TPR) repeat protein
MLDALHRARVFSVGVLAVLLLVLVTACGGSEEREAKYLERGKALFERQELAKARIEFRNALKINPTGVEARYYVALIDEREGNWQKAFTNLQRVVQQKPDHLEARIKLGHIFVLSGNLDKAAEQAKVASGLAPDNTEVLALQGAIELRNGNLPEAKALALRALAVDPKSVTVASLLAGINQRSGDSQAALASLAQGIENNPENVALHLMKLKLHLDQKNLREAEKAYRELFALQPEEYSYRKALAQLYVSEGRIDAGEQVLREAIAQGIGGTETKLDLVDLLTERKSIEAALTELARLIDEDPGEFALGFRLAELQARNNALDKSEATLRDIVERDGVNTNGLTARVSIARLRFAQGDPEGGDQLVREVLKESPTNPEALLLRAGRSIEQGDFQQAIVDTRTVLRNVPDSRPALRLQTDAQLRSGETELAIETLNRLIELDPRDTNIRLQLASLLTQRGSQDRALKLFEQLEGDVADAPPVLAARTALLIDQQNFGEAEATIRRIRALPEQTALAESLNGSLLQAQGRHRDAVGAFERALALRPGATDLITNIVRSHLADGRSDDAIRFLEQQSAKTPDNAVAPNLLGEVLVTRKRTAEAEAAFRKAITNLKGWPVPYLNLVNLYAGTGRAEEARAAAREGLGQVPDDVGLLLALAAAEEAANAFDAAIATYGSLLDKRPDLDVAANNFAALVADHQYQNRDQLARARKAADRFENSNNAFFVDTLGWVQFRQSELALARVNLERAIKLRDDVPQLHYHLGMVLVALGEQQKAKETLARAVGEGATYPGLDEAKATLARL